MSASVHPELRELGYTRPARSQLLEYILRMVGWQLALSGTPIIINPEVRPGEVVLSCPSGPQKLRAAAHAA